MTTYRCPRADLGCAAELPTTGDLDYHLHLAHGYRRLLRLMAGLRPERRHARAPQARRRLPAGFDDGPGSPTAAARPSAAAAIARARHRDRTQEREALRPGPRARHRDRSQEREAAGVGSRSRHRNNGAGSGRQGRGRHALDDGRRL